jgi:hypothetical protein
MFSRKWVAAALSATMLLTPLSAFAQQMPQAPDGTSVNEPPAAGPEASTDACGNTPQSAFGQTTSAGTPQGTNDLNPKDETGAQPIANMSKVTGFVVYTAGDLVLLRVQTEPAAGTANSNPPTMDTTMAVIRLPNGCLPALSDGTQVTAVGVPTPAGILNAEQVQIAD